MSHHKTLPVKLWGPMILTTLVALSLNNTRVAAEESTSLNINQEQSSQTGTVAPSSVKVSGGTVSDLASTSEHKSSHQNSNETTATSTSSVNTESDNLYVSAQPLTDSNTAANTASSEQANKPYGVESNTIINVPKVWDENYKGQGTVVAVIDSGIDVEHDVLQLTDVETAKFKSQEEMEAKKAEVGISYGQWYNDKLIFAYNYTDVNDDLKESNAKSHGMHVSGTAVGNPSKPDASGNYIYGVAPEAQLMFMRVFSDVRGGGTQDLLYVRAIEDAVKLGADTINLSLGSPNGSLINVGDHLTRAISAARANGVTVVMAAGNDYNFGGQTHPYASNPDFGVVASPATARDGIAVAAYNNTHVTREVLNIVGMEGMEAFNNGSVAFTRGSNSKRDFQAGKEYDYVYVNLGKEEDFEGKELKGKIALIQRGEINFDVKVANAMKAGAAGAVVFNNVTQTQLFTMTIPGSETAIFPSVFIAKEFGDELAAKAGTGTYKIKFSGSFEVAENPDAGQMADFTSWGLSIDGELKPDVTAPGGEIFSSYNDNTYGSSSGTSMASPHIAGVVALMKQALKDKWPELTPAEFQTRLKQLLMSTALPHINEDTKAYTSPRRQGAGIADTYNAIHSDLIVTGLDDLSSITLGNVADTFSFAVRLHNISNQAKTVTYVTHLNTDGVEDGRFTLKPRELAKVEGGQVTVEANSSITIPITLDASTFAEELSKLMVNGYFLEGFVRFLDAVDGGDLVSIPFVGFRGEFQDLPVIEKPVYDFDINNGDLPFYYDKAEDAVTDELPFSEERPFTSLLFSEAIWDHEKGAYLPEVPKIAGTYEDKDGNFVLKRDENGQPYLILSPSNADNTHDGLMFRGVFLRSFKDLVATVYRADDTERTSPLWKSTPVSGSKNHYGNDPSNAKATAVLETFWDGKDQSKNILPDGKYVYVVTYSPRVPGAKEQEMTFNIELNSIRPAATTAIIDEEARTFKPRPSITNGGPAIYRERVYYTIPVAERSTESEDGSGRQTIHSNEKRVYIEADENGVYTLLTHDENGKELNLSAFWYRIENLAGIQLAANITEFLPIGNESAMVQFGLLDPETDNWVELDLRYMIRNEDGDLVHDLTSVGGGATHHILPFGTYTVELFLHDEENAYLIDERIKTFTVTEENSLEAISFKVKVLKREAFTIDFDTEPPVGTKIYLVDKDGKKIELPQGRYTKDIFEKNIVTGDYTIAIELPEGYHATENDFPYSIVPEGTNRKDLGLWSKGDVEENGGAAETAEELPSFDLEADSDGDGYANQDELTAGSNPFDATSIPVTAKGEEGNGEATSEEQPEFKFEDDHDGDGFSSEEELTLGTDPTDKADFPQTAKGDATTKEQPEFKFEDDHDGDSFSTEEEMTAGTNPFDSNSFPIKSEKINTNLINDDKPNFDGDGDEDKDGFSSKDELNLGTNPLDKSDFPQTANGGATTEVKPEFKFEDDHDADSFSTEEEMTAGTNPFDNNSFPIKEEKINANLINDDKPNFNVDGDEDKDGFSNKDELDLSTNPLDKSDFPQTAKGDQDKHGAAETSEPLPVFVPAPQKDKKAAQEIKTAPTAPTAPTDPTAPAAASQQASSPAKAAKKELPATGDRTSILTLTGVLISSAMLFALHQGKKSR